jgi:hypothetical protein
MLGPPEYNEERPKKALGGLTPITYAQQLKVTPDSKPTRTQTWGNVGAGLADNAADCYDRPHVDE